ncbi:endonuclease/exonuclease/phosphatase family protein [Yasminevirus sp. GU-2018]|uniref:Endonuclease/exonuclease/phosphatase family protein n=1 Tax=Yasminevirus sp. GU-2018 TaxID=2420051 RepID=A0A5K0U8P3_9VIRU|nr:endonuclease/exonuclease/phosphatase family protein [Yasminevirus sp. GU-2018]
MKILQYNIYFGEHRGVSLSDRLQNVCGCIMEQNADVVCVQEVLRDSYSLMTALLKDMYPYAYPDPQDGIEIAYGTAIFSKFPIKRATTHKFEFTSMGRDIKLVMVEDDKNSKYYICNVHFESEFKDKCMKKIYQYSRCSDILYHLHKKTNIPVILCADTNVCNDSSKAFHEAFSFAKGWRDAWIENGSSKATELTFDSETNPILLSRYGDLNEGAKQKYKSRLDRVLHLSNMHMIDFKLVGADNTKILSDHYGIVCDISQNKPETRGDYIPPYISPNNRPRTKDVKAILEAGTKDVKPKTTGQRVPTKKLF